jgi:uncharacterized glyoxalase superfamily protein PhnB
VATVSVRYIVHNVDAAITFYCRHLGFREQMHPAPTFAMLTRGNLRLLRSAPITAVGGKQVVIDDPSGNPVELFEPTRAEARLNDS